MTREDSYPERLRRAEAEAISRRTGGRRDTPVVGLALSGGGIRSATFSLGVLQALAKEQLLSGIDCLSTVSGGGYIGAFFGALFLPGRWARSGVGSVPEAEQRPEDIQRRVADALTDTQSWPVHWLRQSGHYLSPIGTADALVAIAGYLRNWVAIHVVLGTLLLVPLASVELLKQALTRLTAGLPGYPAALKGWELPILSALVLLGWSLPAGAAYWASTGFLLLLILLALLVAGLLGSSALAAVSADGWVILAVLLLVLATAVYFALAYPNALSRRRNLTDGLKISLVVVAALIGLSVVEGLGGAIHSTLRLGRQFWLPFAAAPIIAIPFTFAQTVAPRLLALVRPRVRLSPALVALAIALMATTLELSILSATVHGLSASVTAWIAAAALVASILMGHTREFLNLSSHSTLYTARLTRAYLGASNPARQRDSKPLIDPIPGDEIAMHQYRPHEHGGPLHLVNVTLNETLDGETQVEYRDRKGLNMAVGPFAISVGVRHHAMADWGDGSASVSGWRRMVSAPPPIVRLGRIAPEAGYQVFAPAELRADALSLGRWVAVSGAAVSTGLGSRTSFGLSLLLGLANIRLGYWWKSGCDHGARKQATALTDTETAWRAITRLLPVQAHLIDECVARFYGPSRSLWYLSDGGHFDNTGLYELIRRRVPFIIACDNGADPDYAWQDVGDFVRKARADFDAEIRFLERHELDERLAPGLKPYVASWEDFRRFERGAGRRSTASPAGGSSSDAAYASLAEVSYLGSTLKTTILFVKPNLRGDESADLLTFWKSHPDFPQETTLDQYFDEAQWESYRCLGEHVGRCLFRAQGSAGWSPRVPFAAAGDPPTQR